MSLLSWISRRLKSGLFWFTLVTAVVLVVGVWLSWRYWDDLHSNQEALSTTLRNLGLLIGGAITLVFAVWRGLVAERQAQAARRQADTAQQSLLNERYQQGAEMLGNEILTVRLGGIYALQRLAEEHPEQYHVQVMRLFCAFVRYPARENEPQSREDVQAVMVAIGARHMRQLELEWHANLKLDLHFADLSIMTLEGANLSNAELWHVDLSKAGLDDSDLSDAQLWDANLSRAELDDANLSGTEFSMDDGEAAATGLTQAQLDAACADPDNPPKLDGVVDAETGEPLVWRGKPLNE